MSEDNNQPLEYTIHLSRHGRLSGDLAVTGIVNDLAKEGIEKRILIYSCMIDAENVMITRNPEELKNNIVHNVTFYGDPYATMAHVENEFLTGDPMNYLLKNPQADIFLVKGIIGSIVLEEKFGILGFSGGFFSKLSQIFKSYEQQFKKGRIDYETMKRVQERINLPAYWFCTKRVEKLRMYAKTAELIGDMDTQIYYGQKLEWWTKLMSKED